MENTNLIGNAMKINYTWPDRHSNHPLSIIKQLQTSIRRSVPSDEQTFQET